MELDLLYQEFRNIPEQQKAELMASMQKLETTFKEMEGILTQLDLRGKDYDELVANIKTNLLGKNLKSFKNKVPAGTKAYQHFSKSVMLLKKT